MCDTLGIGPSYTSSGISIFGKNSDREADETQLVLSIPRKTFPERKDLRCTYITIPQTVSTHAIVLSKPFWLWGAEMGVNEKGVAIGNEALFTRVKSEKEPGLIGMDLVRLALERSAAADEAANIIIELLIKYGQAGPCGYRNKKFSYMNSFIIMDRQGILTLETVGRDYAVKHHTGHAVISNGITITDDWDRSSLPTGTDLSTYTDALTTFFAGSTYRKGQGDSAILKAKGTISVTDVFQMLRSHYNHSPAKGINRDVCMHASDPLIRRSQTTGSMVVELHPDNKIRIFVTAGSAPCLTPFKPFMPEAPFMDAGRGEGSYSEESYWWRHEAYHINAMFRYDSMRPLVKDRIREQETQWTAGMPAHDWNSTEVSLKDTSHNAFAQSEHFEKAALNQIMGMKKQSFRMSNLFWRRMARRSGVPMV